LTRRILPLAAIASILALVAGLYANRPLQSERPVPEPPRRQATPPPDTGSSAEPCAFPLRWHVARLDSQFGLSRGEAIVAVEDAASLWNDATGRSLFLQDEAEGLPIAFVYDGRQAAAQERMRQRAQFEERARRIDVERAELEAMRERQAAARADYERRLTAFNEWSERHNEAVHQWNRDGDVPEEILRELRANDERLRIEERQLTEERREMEAEGQALAAEIERLGRMVDEQDSMGAALGRVFGSGSVLAGRYVEARTRDGRMIEGAREIHVLQFDDSDHLRLVIAHELGHSMGLRHTDNSVAVMRAEHELAGATATPAVASGDVALLRARCPEL